MLKALVYSIGGAIIVLLTT